MSTTNDDHHTATSEDVDRGVLAAIDTVAQTVETLARAAGELVGDVDESGDRVADHLSVAAQGAANVAQAADLWTGIGVGLTEMRQRLLAGADRTIMVEGGEQP